MKKAIFFSNLVIISTVLGMQNNVIKEKGKSPESLVAVENSLALENCATWTPRDWITKIISIPRNKEDFNAPQNSNGQTILMCATKNADCKIMQQILNAKDSQGNKLIDINATDINGNTALSIATELKDIEKMRLLLKNDADAKLLKGKISSGAYKYLKDLANIGFRNAILNRNSKEVKSLLKKLPVDVNAPLGGPTALKWAALTGDNEIVEMLLEHPDIDVNLQDALGCTALMWAIIPLVTFSQKMETNEITENINRRMRIIELLLKHPDIDVNLKPSNGSNALFLAVTGNCKEAVNLLLQNKKININTQDNKGRTALMLAARDGKAEIVDLLLEHKKINVNIQENVGCTALTFAAMRGHEKIVKMLLKHPDININLQDNQEFTALMWAIFPFYTFEFFKPQSFSEEFQKSLKALENDCQYKKSKKKLDALNTSQQVRLIKLLLKHPDIDINAKCIVKNTALYFAVGGNCKEIVNLLLQHKKIDVNMPNVFGVTPLIIAADRGYSEILKLLLKHPKIDVNAKWEEGETALLRSVWQGLDKSVELLLKHPQIDVNLDKKGFTPLMFAATKGYDRIVELLLKHPKIKVNHNNNEKYCTALVCSAALGYDKIVEQLLTRPEIRVNVESIDGVTELICAAANGHDKVVELLLKHPKTDVNVKSRYGATALIYAVARGQNKIVKRLLKHPQIEVNTKISSSSCLEIWSKDTALPLAVLKFSDQDTALSLAVKDGHKEIVTMLLKHPDIDVNATYFTPLTRAIQRDDEDMVRLLLKHPKIKVKEHNMMSPLFTAVVNGREEIVKLLLKKGADINEKTLQSTTPLIASVLFGQPRITNLLLNQPNIDVNARNYEGKTALDIAEEFGYKKIVKLFHAKLKPQRQQIDPFRAKVEHTPSKKINKEFLNAVSCGNIDKINLFLDEENPDGTIVVDINARNKNGDTALIIASENGNLNAVRTLLSYDADLSLKGANGDNALIRAAQKGNFDVVEELLYRKENINSINNYNRTALMESAENGHLRVVKLLLKKKAKISLKDKSDRTVLDLVNAKIKELHESQNADYKNIKNLLEKQIKPSNASEPIDVTQGSSTEISSFDPISGISLNLLTKISSINPINDIALNLPHLTSSFDWNVVSDKRYEKDLKEWEKNDPSVFEKIQNLVQMIEFDPFRGPGQPEQLSGSLEGLYSRRINKQNRLVYEVDGEKVILKSCKGHYKREKRNRTRTYSKN